MQREFYFTVFSFLLRHILQFFLYSLQSFFYKFDINMFYMSPVIVKLSFSSFFSQLSIQKQYRQLSKHEYIPIFHLDIVLLRVLLLTTVVWNQRYRHLTSTDLIVFTGYHKRGALTPKTSIYTITFLKCNKAFLTKEFPTKSWFVSFLLRSLAHLFVSKN